MILTKYFLNSLSAGVKLATPSPFPKKKRPILDEIITATQNEIQIDVSAGEHIVVYWDEDEDVSTWYLALVEKVDIGKGAYVSHFHRAKNGNDSEWVFSKCN